jgi:RHS repeat-associated protein
LTDQVDSVSMVLSEQGKPLTAFEYLPYGETWLERVQGGLKEKHNPKYNSQELDTETDFYYYNARYYDPEISRFVTADTVIDGEHASQGWNRYMYVKGNPIRYSDPTGHGILDDVLDIASTVGSGMAKQLKSDVAELKQKAAKSITESLDKAKDSCNKFISNVKTDIKQKAYDYVEEVTGEKIDKYARRSHQTQISGNGRPQMMQSNEHDMYPNSTGSNPNDSAKTNQADTYYARYLPMGKPIAYVAGINDKIEEGLSKIKSEKSKIMIAADKKGTHPGSVGHDESMSKKGITGGPELYKTIIPYLIVGKIVEHYNKPFSGTDLNNYIEANKK